MQYIVYVAKLIVLFTYKYALILDFYLTNYSEKITGFTLGQNVSVYIIIQYCYWNQYC